MNAAQRMARAAEHAAAGKYRPAQHGPLPPGVVPVSPKMARPVLVARGKSVAVAPESVALLTAEDCPAVLTKEGRALWGVLVRRRPTERILGLFVAAYVEAALAWERATEKIKAGDYGTPKGELRPVVNPYLKLRREAETSMYRAAMFLNWQVAPVAAADGAQQPETPASKLGLFLASRKRA
jgi:hypothetical protein